MVGLCFFSFLRSVPPLSQVLHFSLNAGQGLLESGLHLHLVRILLLLLALNFSFGFRKLFLTLNPTTSFTVKGLLPDEKLANTISWLLKSKLSDISVIEIVGFALIPSNSLSFASRSLKSEINIIFYQLFIGVGRCFEFFEVTILCLFSKTC